MRSRNTHTADRAVCWRAMSLLTPARQPPARDLAPQPTPSTRAPASPGLALLHRPARLALAVPALFTLVALLWLAWWPWLAPPWWELSAQAAAGCDPQRSVCRATFADGSAVELTLAPGPRPADGSISLRLRPLGFEPGRVSVDLNGDTMNMGPNLTQLAPAQDGHWTGSTSLTACVSGPMTWVLTVRAPAGVNERVARFRFVTGG